jgi:hypothetical protein
MRSPGRSLTNVTDWELTLIDKTHYWPNDIVYTPSKFWLSYLIYNTSLQHDQLNKLINIFVSQRR